MDTQTCNKCNIEKPLDDFSPQPTSGNPTRKHRACKMCRSLHVRKQTERAKMIAATVEGKKTKDAPANDDSDKVAHLRRVPVCICNGRWINPSCEACFACRIDTAHNRAPAAVNYTDF